MTAARAFLAGVVRRHYNHLSAEALTFVRQQSTEQSGGQIEDRPIEARLLRYLTAGVFDRAPG